MMLLASNTLDILSKEYEQLKFMLTYDASLIGSQFIYKIKKRIHEIMLTPASPFGNLDIILCGDLCQEKLVRNCWIFEQTHIKGTRAPYNFWKENVKIYELNQVLRQDNKEFVSILNIIKTCSHIDGHLAFLNNHCYRSIPNYPIFPYLFYLNKNAHEHNERMPSLINK